MKVSSLTKEETLYAKNILLVGTDKSGELSDVIIVARYNPQKKIISLLNPLQMW